ncbi:hypothetical protein Daesc_002512 [Daldinia eschscholtzii]|uniref:Carboxylic ester hydrolase n=1 Tax=Daldinia eschscholtzii TaxID=292717 RepID=A0AAX6MQV4_9PEZI
MRSKLLLSSFLGLNGALAASGVPVGMEDALTTANMPSEFLEDVYFVDHVPLMALQADPRISYALYIPKAHYNPDPSKSETPKKLPLLVYIHGTGRNTVAIYDELVPFADSAPCAILSPLFPAGMDGPNDLDSYKELKSDSLRSDQALLQVFDQVAYRWPGLEMEKVYMMGFSGGGQFAHRFMYLYPEKLAAISIGAPGRPTFIDDTQDWPIGTKDVKTVFDKTVQPNVIGKLPIQLVVGGNDTEIHGDEAFWEWKKNVLGSGGLPPMNETRLESIKELRASWEKLGIKTQFDVVDGVAHNEKGVREAVLGFLGPQLKKSS